MTEPEIVVALSDTEFSVGELRDFLDAIGAVDGMPANALIAISRLGGDAEHPHVYTLTASTHYRTKAAP